MACAIFFLTFLPNLIWAWKEARRWGQDNAASRVGIQGMEIYYNIHRHIGLQTYPALPLVLLPEHIPAAAAPAIAPVAAAALL